MGDSLPTISADQLTKAVNLAAGGTLCDLENSEDGWSSKPAAESSKTLVRQSSEKHEDFVGSETSLKLLEHLSSSVSSNLKHLIHLDGEHNDTNISATSVKGRANYKLSRKKKTDEEIPKPSIRKYSSRKNYKLKPPVVPNQVKSFIRHQFPVCPSQSHLVNAGQRVSLQNAQEVASLSMMPTKLQTQNGANYIILNKVPLMAVDQSSPSSSQPVEAAAQATQSVYSLTQSPGSPQSLSGDRKSGPVPSPAGVPCSVQISIPTTNGAHLASVIVRSEPDSSPQTSMAGLSLPHVVISSDSQITHFQNEATIIAQPAVRNIGPSVVKCPKLSPMEKVSNSDQSTKRDSSVRNDKGLLDIRPKPVCVQPVILSVNPVTGQLVQLTGSGLTLTSQDQVVTQKNSLTSSTNIQNQDTGQSSSNTTVFSASVPNQLQKSLESSPSVFAMGSRSPVQSPLGKATMLSASALSPKVHRVKGTATIVSSPVSSSVPVQGKSTTLCPDSNSAVSVQMSGSKSIIPNTPLRVIPSGVGGGIILLSPYNLPPGGQTVGRLTSVSSYVSSTAVPKLSPSFSSITSATTQSTQQTNARLTLVSSNSRTPTSFHPPHSSSVSLQTVMQTNSHLVAAVNSLSSHASSETTPVQLSDSISTVKPIVHHSSNEATPKGTMSSHVDTTADVLIMSPSSSGTHPSTITPSEAKESNIPVSSLSFILPGQNKHLTSQQISLPDNFVTTVSIQLGQSSPLQMSTVTKVQVGNTSNVIETPGPTNKIGNMQTSTTNTSKPEFDESPPSNLSETEDSMSPMKQSTHQFSQMLNQLSHIAGLWSHSTTIPLSHSNSNQSLNAPFHSPLSLAPTSPDKTTTCIVSSSVRITPPDVLTVMSTTPRMSLTAVPSSQYLASSQHKPTQSCMESTILSHGTVIKGLPPKMRMAVSCMAQTSGTSSTYPSTTAYHTSFQTEAEHVPQKKPRQDEAYAVSPESPPQSSSVSQVSPIALPTNSVQSSSVLTNSLSSSNKLQPTSTITSSVSAVNRSEPVFLKPSMPSPRQSSVPILVPSSDGSKLTLSPAGIQHLQLLLRKRGTTEGYFVIASPRVRPTVNPKSSNKTDATKDDTFFSLEAKSESSVSLGKSPQQDSSTFTKLKGLPGEKKMTPEKTTPGFPDTGSSTTGEQQYTPSQQDTQPSDDQSSLAEDNHSDVDSAASPESRGSSAALVIETSEDEFSMDAQEPGNAIVSSNTSAQDNVESLSSFNNTEEAEQNAEAAKLSEDTALIPQSPLSLCDLIKQQQYFPSFSRSVESASLRSPIASSREEGQKRDNGNSKDDFVFPAPLCRTPGLTLTSQSSHHVDNTDISHEFQLSDMYSPQSLYTTELSFDSRVPTSSVTSQDSNTVNSEPHHQTDKSSQEMRKSIDAPSPQSPGTSQATETGPINPPMTPNTMLINLLNRVPTPLLTNHTDLLTTPSSNTHVNGTEALHSEFERGKQEMYNTGKHLHNSVDPQSSDHLPSVDHEFSLNLAHQSSGNKMDFANEQQIFQQDLIGHGNHLSHSLQVLHFSGGQIDAHKVFEANAVESRGIEYSRGKDVDGARGNFDGSPEKSLFSEYTSDSSGCMTCSIPLTVTVNLDMASQSSQLEHNADGKGSILPSDQNQSIFLENSDTHHQSQQQLLSNSVRSAIPKSIDTDILRHLIHNTSTSSLSMLPNTQQPVQAAEQSLRLSSVPFDLSSTNLTHPPAHTYDCAVNTVNATFLDSSTQDIHLGKHQGDRGLDQEGSFHGDESFHQMEAMHGQPTGDYDTSNPGYKDVIFDNSQHQSYGTSGQGAFSGEGAAADALDGSMNSAFIISGSLQNNSSYSSLSSHPYIETNHQMSNFAPNDQSDTGYFIHYHTQPENPSEQTHYHTQPQNPTEQSHYHTQTQNTTNPSHYHAQSQNQADQTQSLHHFDPEGSHHSLNFHLNDLQRPPPPHLGDGSSQPQFDQPSMAHGHPDTAANLYRDSSTDPSQPYLEAQYPSQFYQGGGTLAPEMPVYSQHCAVGSEAPAMPSQADLNIPFTAAPTGLSLEFQFPNEEGEEGDADSGRLAKHPVLPSASFSPPSVADQAAVPESGSMYNGSFQNLAAYEMYMRGGHIDPRGPQPENVPASGNFCVECNTMYKTQCKFHSCDYVYVTDSPILSHARLTLPTCLKFGISDIVGHTSTTGVFAKEKITIRTKFGPLIGSSVSCDQMGSTRSFSLWQTFLGNNIRVVDTSDENTSNWLMFVKPARVSVEQNLSVFQHGNSVFFVTCRDIEPGQELLYWFAKDYARMLGITAKPRTAHHQLCPHCTVCKQVFPDRKQVQSHIRLQHPKPCKKNCPHCPRKFSKVSHLNTHINAVHLQVKKFMCPHCGKRFSDSSNMWKHIRSHSDERRFKCRLCGKEFKQKAHLQIHMNTHMPVKNEQCGFCGERFSRAFSRKQHEQQHMKQNKITCPHCEKVFYKQRVFKEHLKIHNNERNFPCTQCGKAFRTKSKLARHSPGCKQRKRTLVSNLATPAPAPGPSSHSEESGTSRSSNSAQMFAMDP